MDICSLSEDKAVSRVKHRYSYRFYANAYCRRHSVDLLFPFNLVYSPLIVRSGPAHFSVWIDRPNTRARAGPHDFLRQLWSRFVFVHLRRRGYPVPYMPAHSGLQAFCAGWLYSANERDFHTTPHISTLTSQIFGSGVAQTLDTSMSMYGVHTYIIEASRFSAGFRPYGEVGPNCRTKGYGSLVLLVNQDIGPFFFGRRHPDLNEPNLQYRK